MKIAEVLVEARFVSRPNRFIAQVEIDGRPETVHVKNTGRCREILVPGTTVWLEPSDKPGRKTAYDLVAAEKPGRGVINIDSTLPNRLMKDWLQGCGEFDVVKAEQVCGTSRLTSIWNAVVSRCGWRSRAVRWSRTGRDGFRMPPLSEDAAM